MAHDITQRKHLVYCVCCFSYYHAYSLVIREVVDSRTKQKNHRTRNIGLRYHVGQSTFATVEDSTTHFRAEYGSSSAEVGRYERLNMS